MMYTQIADLVNKMESRSSYMEPKMLSLLKALQEPECMNLMQNFLRKATDLAEKEGIEPGRNGDQPGSLETGAQHPLPDLVNGGKGDGNDKNHTKPALRELFGKTISKKRALRYTSSNLSRWTMKWWFIAMLP